jgi:REP element-mobilizing transposase RayT
MWLNDAGQIVERVWLGLPERFPYVALDEFVIMPNHFHGILVINDLVGAPLAAPGFKSDEISGAASGAPTLGTIVRGLKSISAIDVNRLLNRQRRPLWQRNYYERVIRNEIELSAVREYIHFNPTNWAEDNVGAPLAAPGSKSDKFP